MFSIGSAKKTKQKNQWNISALLTMHTEFNTGELFPVLRPVSSASG